MRYKTKININGAELLDEQSDTASSITDVQLATACGNGFQIGGTASSQLSLTVLKPYKDRFDGDKIDFYIFEVEDTDTTISELVEEVGDSTETVAVEDDDQNDAIETAEDEEEGEEVTEEEEAEATTEADAVAANLYDIMNGEEETEETEEVEEDTEQGWILYGSFYVYKQTNNSDGSITLSAYDGFSLMNGTYTPGITSGTFQQYYDDLRTQLATLGVVMDEDEWDDTYTITWNQVASYREAAGYLAGLQGGFATFGDDNTLGISQYGYNEGVLLKSAMQTWKETSSGQTEIDSIICTTNLAGNTILAGESGGQPLSFYNPFMTQEILDGILSEYNGITYTGAVFSCNWDAGLLSGELVRVMSDEEFKNLLAMQNAMANSSSMTTDEILELKKQINSVGKSILISSQTISFTAGGETIAEITSYLPTESEKANAPLSPSDAKFRTVTADLIKTKELIADKASITDLEAVTGRVTTLESETVKASELDAKVATIVEADIKTAEIDGAQIKDATITNAKIDSINGEKITDGSIVAAALSKEAIKTLGGNKVYYQATEPTGETYAEGDIWYKTVTETSGDKASILYVYDSTAWVNKPFDSESILTKSITAGEIASGTITAGEIDMDNLQTSIARIGSEDGTHVVIDSDSVDIVDGQTTLASYGEATLIGNGYSQIQLESNKITLTTETHATNPEPMFVVGNMKDTKTGYGTHSEWYVWNGDTVSEVTVPVMWWIKEVLLVTVDGVETTDYSESGKKVTINMQVTDSAEIHIKYTSTDPVPYATIGNRSDNAVGYNSFAQGNGNVAAGNQSHAEGSYTYASGFASHAEGKNTIANADYQHVQGLLNKTDKSQAFIIGNGSEETNTRSNAFTVDWEGNTVASGSLNGTDLNIGGKNWLEVIYPVGSIYMSVNSTDPSNLFGGTWEQIQDTFLLASGSTYTAGATGGEAEHTLTTAEMPSHTHAFTYTAFGGDKGTLHYEVGGAISGSGSKYAYIEGSATNRYPSGTKSTGSSNAHNNMPPYLAVCVWKRIA